MSSFQRAREALGIRLREMRLAARLTGKQLAEQNEWHPSKVSKIEGGKQTPAEVDLEAWAVACGQADLTPDLVAKLPLAPVHGFWLMDEHVVVVENFTASQNLTQASEISAYVRIFDQLAGAARYESDARTVIIRALADLRASMN